MKILSHLCIFLIATMTSIQFSFSSEIRFSKSYTYREHIADDHSNSIDFKKFTNNPIGQFLVWDIGISQIDVTVLNTQNQIENNLNFNNERVTHCGNPKIFCSRPTILDLKWQLSGRFKNAEANGEYLETTVGPEMSTKLVRAMPRFSHVGVWKLIDPERKIEEFSMTCHGISWGNYIGKGLSAQSCNFKIHKRLIL